jgi:tetratricopeptide (TPR) repeat protein
MSANRQALDIANKQDVSEQTMIEVGNALLDAGAATDALQIARRASTMIEAIRSVEATEAAAPKAAVLLGRSGAPADALALLSKLHTDARDPALTELAIALARDGDCCFALVTVQEIFNEQRREAALGAVAEIFGPDASKFVAAADRIESTQERSQALSALASILARTDSTEARSLAQSALDLACSLGNDHRVAEAISKAVEPMAVLGDHERALEIARRIGYQLHRSRALTAVVRALVSRRDFDLAEGIAAEISEHDRGSAVRDLLVALLADRKWDRALTVASLVEPYERHVTLTWLSDAFLDAGETERAIQAAKLALQSAVENGVHGATTAALCAAVRAYMRAGDVESALGAAGLVSVQQDPNAPLLERLGAWLTMAQDRLRVRTEIAWADADAGRPDAAIRLLMRSESPAGIADAFRAIAERLFERGRVDEAVDFAERSLQLAPELEDDLSAPRMTKWTVALLARAGRWERATEVARTAGDDYAADVVLKHRVSQEIADGCYDDALKLVAEMKFGSLRCEAQADVACGLAQTGSWERAIHIASELHGDRDAYAYIERSAALSDITLKLARAGLADQALTLATDLLIAPQKRKRYFTAVSLVEIAEALASAGQTGRCVELLERALGVAKESSPGHNLAYQLTRVAAAFAIAGQEQRTVELIDGLPSAGDRMKALSDVAERLEEARMYEVSLELSEHSLTIAEQTNDVFNRAVAQSHVASALAWLGDVDGALRLIARIENSHKQGLAIKAAARPIVEAGRVDDLKEVIGRIKETSDRSRALRAVAVALAVAGHPNLQSNEERMLLGGEESSADIDIGGAESAAGMQRKAVERLEHAAVLAHGDDSRRQKVALDFARAKRFERALDMLRAVELGTNGTEGTDGALAQMAPYFAGAGRAGDLLSVLESRLSSPRTLRALIEALVATGHIDAAVQGWRFVLEHSVGRDSDDIFDLVAAGATALAQMDGGATLSKMCDRMLEVDAWWER